MTRITFDMDKHLLENAWQKFVILRRKKDDKFPYMRHHFYERVMNVGLKMLDKEFEVKDAKTQSH